jgi:hypothetical protein
MQDWTRLEHPTGMWTGRRHVPLTSRSHDTSGHTDPNVCRTRPMDDVVERAINAAIESLPPGEWPLLPPSERTRRIYHEMRRLDAERVTLPQSESSH